MQFKARVSNPKGIKFYFGLSAIKMQMREVSNPKGIKFYVIAPPRFIKF